MWFMHCIVLLFSKDGGVEVDGGNESRCLDDVLTAPTTYPEEYAYT